MNNTKFNVVKYFLSVSLIYLILFLATNIFTEKTVAIKTFNYDDIEKRNIFKKTDNYLLDIEYPKINNYKFDKIIRDFIYKEANSLINNNKTNKSLTIDYEIYQKDNIMNIFFTINSSLNKKFTYKSFNFNTNDVSLVFSKITDSNMEKLKETAKKKYTNNIASQIEKIPTNDIELKLTDNGIIYYFNYDLFDNIDYTPEFYFDYDGNIILEREFTKPYKIAFTFDDGPSEYTKEIVDTLKLNNSTATFFMLGNRMKYNQEIVKYVIENNMEVGSHSYSHKNLNNISDEEILEEINSTTIIFNEITKRNIKLFRPPYGNANNKVKSLVPFPLIKWNIDTEDWLYRDSKRTYNHIVENACDGCIVLMHDLYPETLEAVKMVAPKLNEMGYEITTVSKLAESKKIELLRGIIYRSFNNYNLPF